MAGVRVVRRGRYFRVLRVTGFLGAAMGVILETFSGSWVMSVRVVHMPS
jgi:hypothetical protein